MNLFIKNTKDYDACINEANKLDGSYEDPVTFHSYWGGNLNEKHLYSILSCYYFNILGTNNKIILWVDNKNPDGSYSERTPNEFDEEIRKYCEIREFHFSEEKKKSEILNCDFYHRKSLSFFSDPVRYLLLYNYGGCYFDLDCFFLRSFEPLFSNFKDDICVYNWGMKNHPNGAIYISLKEKSLKMKNNIKFILERGKGWGFREALLTFDLPLDLLVLPSNWFNGAWGCTEHSLIKNKGFPGTNISTNTKSFFKNSQKVYNFQNFYSGAFCYHWHNMWNDRIEEKSPIKQLVDLILSKI